MCTRMVILHTAVAGMCQLYSSTNSQVLSLLTLNISQKHCETGSLQTTGTDSDVKMSPDYLFHRNEWYVIN